jgi:hypothetical protein
MNQFDELKSIFLNKNNKNPQSAWKESKNQYKTLESRNYYEKGILKNNFNVGVITGKDNNIIVVDIDLYKFSDDNLFLKTFGGEEYIKTCNTFTVKTPRGGFHLYYEYDESIYNTQNSTHQIDIRCDGGYIVKFGSVIDGTEYKIYNNKEIQKMPSDLKEWLITYITPKKENKIKQNLKSDLEIKKLESVDYSLSFIDDFKQELQKTKKNLFVESNGFLKFTNGMKILGLSEEWDAYNKTQDKYDYNNNLKYWNSCNTEKFNYVNWICQKLEIQNYLLYKPILKNLIEPIEQFFKPKLGHDFFDTLNTNYNYSELSEFVDENNNIIVNKKQYSYIIKSDTGTGKTTSFKHYIKEKNLKFISFVSRVSLGEDQYYGFSEHGINCKFYKYEDEFYEKDNIIVQLESIKKLQNINYGEYTIFLDEFNSIIEHILQSPTLNSNRIYVFNKLIDIINKSKHIICVDADISDLAINFLKKTNKKTIFLQNTYKHNKDIEAVEIEDDNKFFDQLKIEEKFLCCCDSRTDAEKLHARLKKAGIECVLITADTDKELPILDNHDRIIFSPRILYGVDSVMRRPVYAYYTSDDSINPKSMIQQIARCRNIVKLNFFFKTTKYKYNGQTYEEHIKEMMDIDKFAQDEFRELINPEIYNHFLDLYIYYTFNKKSYETNKKAHFLNLLDERGFIRDKSKKYSVKSGSNGSIKTELKEQKLNNFDLQNYLDINNILQLDSETAEDFKDLFIDKYKLTKHFNFCNFLFQTEEKIKKNLLERLDFDIIKIKSDKCKILFLKNIKNLFNNKDISINSKPVSEELSKKINSEYNKIFDKLKITPDYTDKYECDKLQARIYKSLFPDNLIISERNRKKGENEGKTTYTIDNSIIETTETLYKIRNPNNNLKFIDN